MLVGHHFSTVPPDFQNSASFLLPPSVLHYLLISLLYLPPPHLMPLQFLVLFLTALYPPSSCSFSLFQARFSCLLLTICLTQLLAHFPTLLESLFFHCLLLDPRFYIHASPPFPHPHTFPEVTYSIWLCPLAQTPAISTTPFLCCSLPSSPLCCLLIYLRKSSGKIRFLFSSSVQSKLSLHAPVHLYE